MSSTYELLVFKSVSKEIESCDKQCNKCILEHYCESIIECVQQQDKERSKGLLNELINDHDLKCGRECLDECDNCNFETACYMFY